MGKINNVIDDIIGAIDKKSTLAEQEYFENNKVDEGLSKIERVFPQEVVEDYSLLKNVSEEDFNNLVGSLYGADDKLIKILKGAYYVIKNDIGLFDSQVSRLNELLSKANESRRDLELTSKRLDDLAESIRLYNGLKESLGKVKNDGVLDISLIDSIVGALDFSEEDVSDYLDSVLMFNLDRYRGLSVGFINTLDVGNDLVSSRETPVVEEESVFEPVEEQSNMESVDLSEVSEGEKIEVTEEKLREVFAKFGFDLSKLQPELVSNLVSNGDLDNIINVLDALSKNKLSQFFEGKKKGEILTKFLLNSEGKIINHVCEILDGYGIDKKYFGSYIPAFFPSIGDRRLSVNKKKNNNDTTGNLEVVRDSSSLIINGAYEDFVKNVDYITNNFDCDKTRLFERCVTVLTMSHERLLRNIDDLNLYGYNVNGKFPLSTLAGRRIMDSTDSFIEVGEGNYLRKSAPSKLLLECRNIARNIAAYQKMGIPYRSDFSYGAIKKTVTTISSESDLSVYRIRELVPDDGSKLLQGNRYYDILTKNYPRTISDKTMEDLFVKELEEKFRVNDDVYKFDDVLISRRKLLRNYEFLMNTDLVSSEEKKNNSHDILLAAALCNSFIGVEEMEKVDRGISEVVSSKGGKHEVSKK